MHYILSNEIIVIILTTDFNTITGYSQILIFPVVIFMLSQISCNPSSTMFHQFPRGRPVSFQLVSSLLFGYN